MARALRFVVLLAAVAAVTACRVKETKTPALAGPSELGLSLTLQATPDVLTQDGSSQATLSVFARDGSGQPVRNVTCRVDIMVDGKLADYGMLSARNITTGNDGRASVVYTAPAASPIAAVATVITLAVTPVGTDFASAVERVVNIRLVPSGTITPPGGAPAYFVFSPETPAEMEAVVFSVKFCENDAIACTPTSATGFSWNFGDGGTATGSTVTHAFTTGGSYSVTLTVTDSRGWPSSTTQPVLVKTGLAPKPSISITPASPKVLQDAIVDGSGSTAAAGRTIVRYVWDFGDGTVKEGVYSHHDWGTAGLYQLKLTVTDDAGRTATKMLVVTVTP
jgi:PKD repeat protein